MMGEALEKGLESCKYFQRTGVIFNPDSTFIVHICWSLLENPSLCKSPEEEVPIPSRFCKSSAWKSAWNIISQLKQHQEYSPSLTFISIFQLCLTPLLTLGSYSSLKNIENPGKYVPGLFFSAQKDAKCEVLTSASSFRFLEYVSLLH